MSRYNHGRSKTVVFGTLTVLMILFIWGNSCLSREVSGAQSGVIARFLRSILDPNGKIAEEVFHHALRKTAHFAEFAVLGLFVGGFFLSIRAQSGKKFVAFPILVVLLVAVLDEYLQFFTGRGSMVTDVVLDFCGALTGLATAGLFALLSKKASHKN